MATYYFGPNFNSMFSILNEKNIDSKIVAPTSLGGVILHLITLGAITFAIIVLVVLVVLVGFFRYEEF